MTVKEARLKMNQIKNNIADLGKYRDGEIKSIPRPTIEDVIDQLYEYIDLIDIAKVDL